MTFHTNSCDRDHRWVRAHLESASSRSNQTEEIIAGLMERAHIAPKASPEKCRKMACKFLWILKRSTTGWIPTRSCLDLTTLGAALTPDEEKLSVAEVREIWSTDAIKARKARSTPRHFKTCKQCGVRFLASRSNQEFHTKRCAIRWRRAHPVGQDDARNWQASSATRINIGD